MQQLTIAAPDGAAPAVLWDGPGPAVLCLIDGRAMRPAIQAVGARIAAAGYRVLMPDLFYRLGPYVAPTVPAMTADPRIGQAWAARIASAGTDAQLVGDIGAYLDHLAAPRVGVVGYCMGGRLAVRAAAAYPERVVAAAAYHPGDLVTAAPDSPHHNVDTIRAQLYVGRASDDARFDDAAHQALADALTAAGVVHHIERYPGRHGWVPSDTPAHDPAGAERHFETLFALLAATLP